MPPSDGVPPQSLEMEQAVLGAMLVDTAAISRAALILRPEDFYRDAHRILFETMQEMVARDEAVDNMTLREALNAKGLLDNIGGLPYLMQLEDAVPAAANVEHYAYRVLDKAQRRRGLDALRAARVMLLDEEQEVGASVGRHVRALTEATAGRALHSAMVPVRVSLDVVYEEIERREAAGDAVQGLRTGWHEVDYLTGTLKPGDMVVVAARPSIGKTAWAMQMAAKQALDRRRVAVFSLEMRHHELTERLLCQMGRVDSQALSHGRLDEDGWRRLGQWCASLAEVPLWIDDSSDLSTLAIRERARHLAQREGPIDLVVVDYLQMIRGDAKTENRTQEISAMAREVKRLARELECVVVVLSQLNRRVEERPDKRPLLAHLRESGSIEAEADLVILLYREAYYWPDRAGPDGIGKAEVTVAKHRNGPTGTAVLAFHPSWMRFDDWDEQHDPGPQSPALPYKEDQHS